MKLREHATSIVLVLLAAGAATYALVDRDSVTVREAKEREGRVFVVWRREELSRVSIARQGAGTIVLENTADDAGEKSWWMREPRVEKADSDAVDKLLGAFEFATPVRKVDQDAGIGGFDAPRVTGSVAMGSLATTFALGADAPTPKGSAYLRVDGPTQHDVFVVPYDFVVALTQAASTYRTKAIVPYFSVELSKMEVRSASTGFSITRVDDTSFKLGNGLRASRDDLDKVWSALAELKSEAFLSDDEADRATANPVVTVTMTPSDASAPPGELKIGGACPGHDKDVVVVRTKPTRLSSCAPAGSLAGLSLGEADLVDRHLFATQDGEVSELRVEALPTGNIIDIARKDAGWSERAPKVRDLSKDEADAASALTTSIARALGENPVVSAAPFVPASRVTIHRGPSDAFEIVEVSAPDASGAAVARRAFDGASLSVSAEVARVLFPHEVSLRARTLTPTPLVAKDITSFDSQCDRVGQELHLQESGWTMQIPGGYVMDNAAVLDAVDALARAKPDAWVADYDDGHFGFDAEPPCRITATISRDAAAPSLTLMFGKEASGGGYYAKLKDGAVMIVPKSARALASTYLIDRHGFTLTDLAEVTLTRGSRSITLSSDSGADPDDLVFRTLASLRAERALHLGPALAGVDEGFAAPALVVKAVTRTGEKRRFMLGGETTVDGEKVYFARIDGTDATFAIDVERVRPLLERLPR